MIVPLTNFFPLGLLKNISVISPVCPRHCSIEFMKQVLPRLDIPTNPPDFGKMLLYPGMMVKREE